MGDRPRRRSASARRASRRDRAASRVTWRRVPRALHPTRRCMGRGTARALRRRGACGRPNGDGRADHAARVDPRHAECVHRLEHLGADRRHADRVDLLPRTASGAARHRDRGRRHRHDDRTAARLRITPQPRELLRESDAHRPRDRQRDSHHSPLPRRSDEHGADHPRRRVHGAHDRDRLRRARARRPPRHAVARPRDGRRQPRVHVCGMRGAAVAFAVTACGRSLSRGQRLLAPERAAAAASAKDRRSRLPVRRRRATRP